MNRHLSAPRVLHRLALVWKDMEHANRRLFEIRTGVRVDKTLR